jgi:hypothetical protein
MGAPEFMGAASVPETSSAGRKRTPDLLESLVTS